MAGTVLPLLLALLVWECEGSQNVNQSLPARERYRRLIPYMTFYVDGHTRSQEVPDRYQQVYNPYSQYQGPSDLTRTITQNYLNVKNGRTPVRNPLLRPQAHQVTQVQQGAVQQHVQQGAVQQHVQQVTHHPKMQSGFRPIVSITQSHEIPVQGSTPRPYQHYVTSTYRPVQYVVTPQPYYDYEDIDSNSLFNGYDLSKALPHRITHDNLESSIQTLSKILQILQRANTEVAIKPRPLAERPVPDQRPILDHPITVEPRPQTIEPRPLNIKPHILDRPIDNPIEVKTHISLDARPIDTHPLEPLPLVSFEPRPFKHTKPKHKRVKLPKIHYQDDDEGSTPGKAGVDYPAYSEIPSTKFSCKEQRYKGFFGDPETNCQVWHYCDLNGGQASFLCPNGTIFSQVALTCDWWFNVKCASTAQLYVLNERLYKYILPQKPSFPEDYAGPLVDRYLAIKYQELEEKRRNETTPAQVDDDIEEERPPYETNIARSIKFVEPKQ